jgi:hypothetical protein
MLTIKKPDISKLPGGWEPPFPSFILNEPTNIKKEVLFDNAFVLENVFTDNECDLLIDLMQQSPSCAPVSVHGRTDIPNYEVGSKRTTMWVPELAEQFWNKIKDSFENKICDDFTPTDWWQIKAYKNWEPYSISPLLRFMKYESGGQHFAHYDAGYIYEDSKYRTLMSFVVYLTTNDSGATRFIHDGKGDIPVYDRKHDDWIHESLNEDVICSVSPVKGNILVFEHRICHDVERYIGTDPRIIIRGDITFKAIIDG